IAPCDFWLFPKLKKPLKGQRFDDKTTVENNATSVLKTIPKSEFQDCFEKWKHRWNRVIQFNQVGITSKDATRPMIQNNARAEI
ncbi:hypothetical protein ALC57_16964, partial [Trachymyrmex cornetzi]